jgi:SAM-dependent methyltransferase
MSASNGDSAQRLANEWHIPYTGTRVHRVLRSGRWQTGLKCRSGTAKPRAHRLSEPSAIHFQQQRRDIVLKPMRPALFWNGYARCYDGLLRTIPYCRLLTEVVDVIPSECRSLLDAGCGTGNLLREIRVRRSGIRLHGVDFSSVMLAQARSKTPADLIVGNLDEPLPFPVGTFDVVTCVNVLYAVINPQRTIGELLRVLRPGGLLILTTPQQRPRLRAFIREHAAESGWLRTLPLLLRLLALIAFNLVIFRRGHRGRYHFIPLQMARDMLQCDGIRVAYSGQNWLACVRKGYMQ